MDTRAAALARLFDRLQEGVYIGTIGSDGTTTTLAANPHLKLILGYPADAPDDRVSPFEQDRFVEPSAHAALLERLTTDGAVTDYILRLRKADRSPIWTEVTARAEASAPNGLRVEVLLRDVSERKKRDDETRDIYHQLLQAEKMAALGQTISGVAHELNNPLATILSLAEGLSAKQALEPSMRRALETILGESERAARIVRNLLTFARKRHSTRAMVDVNQIVRETLALRGYGLEVNHVTVNDTLAASLPPVFADGHQLQQVLLNLMMNAEHAMLSTNGQGVLVVRSWHDQEHDTVVLEINDNGPGIPNDVQSKIFDPFFTTKEVGKGTGLGLTVAYAIVNEHGGRIRFDTHPNGGTSFYVNLPITGTRLPPPPPSRAGASPAEKGAGASILLVEDEAALAAAMTDALRDAGYLVERAADGEEALARIHARPFDLVMCDLRMPRLDGQSFYRMLSAAAPKLASRVIFVTGDVAGTETEAFLEESGCRWLAKPFRLSDLLRTVRQGLA